ncbi:MAG TPA: type IV pilus assembly protein PilM [Chthoniobacterales bacterium]|nr:type IV pilus assembly protein PilM [Chthoniobacterales bacterium]
MSPRTRITTLNLGSQNIELAEFRTQARGGLVLCGYRSREILADPAKVGTRDTLILTALREMLGELQIKGGDVNYTVAEESVFTRFVTLPPVGAEKIERIVFFEAQQNVPFPIDDVVWDYQQVGGTADGQVEVILVAIKADLLNDLNRAVEATGLRTAIVDLATMALYNAFRFNYPELTGCSLLVDIGARTTNLLFVEPEKIFTRSVPIGGSSVTSAIAKEFNEPFAAAEFRKKRDGFAALAGADLGSLGADIARVAKIVRSTTTRLHAELMRSISHYCAQQQGNPPQRIFLSGGGASTPYLREFFHEKLQLPIEFFDPLRKLAVADSEDLREIRRSAHLLSEPVGLALRAATDCPIKLNLRPRSVVRRHEWEKRRPFLAGAAALFILSLLCWGAYYTRSAQVIRQSTEGIQEKVAKLRATEPALVQLNRRIAGLDSLAVPLMAAINERGFWPQIIEDLNARLPKEDIWITELVATSGGKPLGPSDARTMSEAPPTLLPKRSAPGEAAIDGLRVRGLYLFNPKQQEVVVDYFRNLVGSPWFAIDPNNQGKVIKPTTPNNLEWAFPYELHLNLRKPVKLP